MSTQQKVLHSCHSSPLQADGQGLRNQVSQPAIANSLGLKRSKAGGEGGDSGGLGGGEGRATGAAASGLGSGRATEPSPATVIFALLVVALG